MQMHQLNYHHSTGTYQGYYSAWNDPSLAPEEASLVNFGTHYADVDAVYELSLEEAIG